MLFAEEDAPELKKWIVKRLENTSDADADVLADYLLALLRHDGTVDEVRKLCEDEIPDFLKEDPVGFVRDVFNALQSKAYLPGAATAPAFTSASISQGLPASAAAAAPFQPQFGNTGFGDGAAGGPPRGPTNGSRKRGFNDRDVEMQDSFAPSASGGDANGRAFKQARRGNMGQGRFDGRGGRHGQGGPQGFQGPHGRGQPMFPQMPGMPNAPPGMPQFDPNDPMSAILAMQAMGFPVPQMPPFVQPGSSPAGGHRPKKGRCRDFDNKGYCARGASCLYEHSTDSAYTPKLDEYDPSNASLAGAENGRFQNGQNNFRGSDRGRGRGRGSDRGGFGQNRRGGRSEFSSDRPNNDRSNTTIVVENIPDEKFSEDSVREFFSEFGNITEVSLKPYKKLALVKYENWDAAKAAHSSPKVIFDNRFVKVYWYTNPDALPKPPADGARNGSPAFAKPAEPEIDIEEFKQKQLEIQRAHEEKMRKKLEMEAAQKELARRQEELLKAQAEERQRLMARLAEKTGKSATPESGDATPNSATGSQTEALKAQLAALEAEAKSLGIDPSATEDSSYGYRGRGRGFRGAPRGRGAYVPRGARGAYRGRGAPFARGGGSHSLDNRPKKIAITGVDLTDPSKDESLRQYLLGVGEFTELDIGNDKSTVTFKDRWTAEKLYFGTRDIPSVGKVDFAWVQTPLPPVNLNKFASTPANDASAGEDTVMDDGDNASRLGAGGQGQGQGQEMSAQDFDYDVADDNDWDNIG